MLRELGCGSRMLAAMVAVYTAALTVIATAVVESKIGVRRGSQTSCLLFVIFINAMVKLIKSNCEADGFLQWLHLLVLMYDTVLLLSTTRLGIMQRNLIPLNHFCTENGMFVNTLKAKFFAIHASARDREPFSIGEMVVQGCDG